MHPRYFLLPVLWLTLVLQGLAATPVPARPFELTSGDRVLFLGDVLLEREDTYGALETRLTAQYADRRITFRNLSWSGDTPAGVSRASFDPPAKGWERLREQIAEVKPTVAFLGFGMAASLQELADRSHDILLNPDATRYGREPMNAARFKNELSELMFEVAKAGAKRIVLLSPISHEDLRALRPGLPDPAAHEKLLAEYTSAVEELARERGATYLALRGRAPEPGRPRTANGIHLHAEGYEWLANAVAGELTGVKLERGPLYEPLRKAIIRKNQLFFHRWRPENYTYLFGFRKKEQGQNAKEIPMFDPLIEQAEREIAELAQGRTVPPPLAPARAVSPAPAAPAPLPLPTFDVQPGYKIELWATNPLLEKPVQMNWDSDGRLWIASSSTYPQVNPEDVAASLARDLASAKPGGPSSGNDRIIILEASKPGGPPDKSTVFAEGLLIPTGVAPFRDAEGHWGCYVGQSTELLELVDTDGDGQADRRRVILSGFGTEDTHHLIHTLKWGSDGQLYFNQSIYIHSHLETPWGLVRMNSGAVLSWHPQTERVDVHFKGFCNPWGHVWDKRGESFITDGAGFQGVSWGVEGAMYFTYENGRKLMPSISPGSYPKFASLEIIDSPHFPAEWQGSLITCDFRAHRIVHFGLSDLTQSTPPTSGFATRELPDLVRTSDISFRPIDVRLGPDGALYVADWSNPVINHGEVDFRDPRRDHHQGRIWKITREGAALLPWEKLSAAVPPEMWRKNPWMASMARQRFLAPNFEKFNLPLLWNDPRSPGFQSGSLHLESAVRDANPRVRLKAMRMLARLPTLASVDLALTAALQAPPSDPYYEYAAWLTINDLAETWTKAVLAGEWRPDSADRVKQLEWALTALDPAISGPVLAKVLADREIPTDGSGPWIDLIGKAGGAPELRRLLELVASRRLQDDAAGKALLALREAMRLRKLKPAGDLSSLEGHLQGTKPEVAASVARLLGVWRTPHARELLTALTTDATNAVPLPVRLAAIGGLQDFGGPEAIATLRQMSARRPAPGAPREAAVALAALDLRGSWAQISALLGDLPTEPEQVETWRAILAAKGAADEVATLLAKPAAALPLSAPAKTAGLRVARELGKGGQKLMAALTPAGGPALAAAPATTDFAAMATLVARDGDPAKGEEIYRRANLLCTTCHAIGGAGGKVGPDLTSLGASAPLDYIIESIVVPAAKVKEGYQALSVTLKDGNMAIGIPSRETAEELFLRNITGQEAAVVKANIATKELVGSIMPAGLAEQLQPREQLDLYAFLAQLGKPGVYDASKGNVARAWMLYPGSALEPYLQGKGWPEGGVTALTLVDGRLTPELLKGPLETLVSPGDLFLAVTTLQNPAGTTSAEANSSLQLEGMAEMWFDREALFGKTRPTPNGPGEHTIVVRLNRNQLPPVLRAGSKVGHFLAH